MENWKCIATYIMFFIIPIFFNSSFNLGNSTSKVLKSSEIRFLIFTHFSFYQLLNLTNYCSFSYFSKSVWFTALFEWRNVWEWYSQEWLPLFLQRKIHGKKLSRYLTHYSLYGVYISLPFLKKKNLLNHFTNSSIVWTG